MNKNRLIRTFSYIIIGVLIGGAVTLYQIKNNTGQNNKSNIVASNFGGTFELTNHLGQPVTDKDFSYKNRLIYFGFTYCPAICPTELQKISMALKEVGDLSKNITPIFVTVDPERDTVEVMKNYVSLFNPRLIGLTGTVKQIEKIKNGYKVYSAKVKDDTMQEYTVDHSSFIYFIDKNNNLVRIFKTDDTAEDISNFIKDYLKE